MSTKTSVRTLFSMSPPDNTSLYQKHFLERARVTILDGYNALHRYLARAAHRTAAAEEHDLQYVVRPPEKEAADNHEGQPEHPVNNQNTSYEQAEQAADVEAAAAHPTGGEGQGNMESRSVHYIYTQIWMALPIVGVLAVIVTPGLVLGVVTGQLPLGIELSSGLATIISLLADLYYRLKK